MCVCVRGGGGKGERGGWGMMDGGSRGGGTEARAIFMALLIWDTGWLAERDGSDTSCKKIKLK